MRILYLKNDPSIDRSTQFVKTSKYEIVEAEFYDDALSLLETDRFDVLLIDHGANPETVQFIVGARALHPDLPVFVISAWGADLRKALESMEAVREFATPYLTGRGRGRAPPFVRAYVLPGGPRLGAAGHSTHRLLWKH